MELLEPSLCVLDETDSGLDIDALQIVADGVNALRSPDRAMVVITHYQRLLELHRARHRARAVQGPGRQDAATRTWRWSWKRTATPAVSTRPRKEFCDERCCGKDRRNGRAVSDSSPAPKAACRVDGRDRGAPTRRSRPMSVRPADRRIEAWQYTDLRALVGEVLPLAASARCGRAEARRAMP